MTTPNKLNIPPPNAAGIPQPLLPKISSGNPMQIPPALNQGGIPPPKFSTANQISKPLVNPTSFAANPILTTAGVSNFRSPSPTFQRAPGLTQSGSFYSGSSFNRNPTNPVGAPLSPSGTSSIPAFPVNAPLRSSYSPIFSGGSTAVTVPSPIIAGPPAPVREIVIAQPVDQSPLTATPSVSPSVSPSISPSVSPSLTSSIPSTNPPSIPTSLQQQSEPVLTHQPIGSQTQQAVIVSAKSPRPFTGRRPNLAPELQHVYVDCADIPEFNLTEFPTNQPDQVPQIIVNPSDSLKQVIDNAPEYSIIIIKSGKYTCSLNISKSLRFIAEGKVSIRSDGSSETVTVTNGVVSFDGFHIKQKVSHLHGNIKVNGNGRLELTNCTLSTVNRGTIVTRNTALLRIINCLVKSDQCSAIIAIDTSEVFIDKCTIGYSNEICVTFGGSSRGIVQLTTFQHCNRGALTSLQNSQLFVDSCKFDDCFCQVGSTGKTNVVKGCTFTSSAKTTGNGQPNVTYGLIATLSAHALFAGNKIIQSTIDCREQSDVQNYLNIYEHSTLLVWGNSVVVAERETFGGQTSAAVSVSHNARLDLRNSVFSKVSGCAVVSYGMTNTSITNCIFESIAQASILAHSGCDIRARDCQINSPQYTPLVFNQANKIELIRVACKGGAASGLESNDTKELILEECSFQAFHKCGMIATNTKVVATSLDIFNNLFSGIHLSHSILSVNKGNITHNAKGGLFACQESEFTLDNVNFVNNIWSAIHIEANSSATITNCAFAENSLAVNAAGKAVLTGCRIYNQPSSALQITGAVTMNECEFSNNGIAALVVDNGHFECQKVKYLHNIIHVEVTRSAESSFSSCIFDGATGETGIHVSRSSKCNLTECTISNSSRAALISDAETNIVQCVITNSALTGVVCGGNSLGKVENCIFDNNGEGGVQCLGGKPVIRNNVFKNQKIYGIYVAKVASPEMIEQNQFEAIQLSHIYHEP
ncbi:hypothetical protein TRFO_42288 [Tritrichomonas foetus]|uniref:Right handed beta helix domain-containing protein n=1 Tax=Tritrichomonas foetus TaxID=1144522 RepID=A0A1J4L1P4_9EUKA|nr:hypothetical protein TRFO_42288 [Tritrichomonas foetus]|eukprot:OHT15813.1 hypothetical protein TRFO_42288 [Tritrichomonas foetus]